MPKKEEIIKDLAEKYKISIQEVERAAMSQFKFAKQMMEKDNFPSIRLPFFGIFRASKKKLNHIKKHNEKNNG